MATQSSGRCGRQGCGARGDLVWYCVDCSCWRCDDCWGTYPNHAHGNLGRDGLEHEKTRYEVFKKLQNILAPHSALSAEEVLQAIEKLHSRDLDSTWFGIRKSSTAQPLLADYDIYSALMGHSLPDGGTRFPNLASFIGQTNAGKSTLIKMLIELHDNAEPTDESPKYPSPVVASVMHTHIPTSADVHLYADPHTYHGRVPLLYADCEGFDGGERLPIGAIESRTPVSNTDTAFSRLTPGRTRALEWADTADKKAREYLVKQLYPRILYTFSDVVIFVLRNARTFESAVFKPLLEWGVSSLEKSINQPTLPHAIIVLNDTDLGVPREEWDVPCATRNLLEANRKCLDPQEGAHFFVQLAEQWRAKGKTIDNILDLLKCYYSTFKVVRIPSKGRYQLMHKQVKKLHHMISDSCDASFEMKRQARMLSSSEEFHVYLQSAFDHFARTLDKPFNFIEVSLRNNPIPDNFGGHILQLALAVQARGRRRDSPWIFEKIYPLVASSIMLDFARHRKGQPEVLFKQYEGYCRYAFEEFCDLYSPCEYRTPTDRCVNLASTHDKGHQNVKGKIIGAGRYVSRFRVNPCYSTWRDNIERAMSDIHRGLLSSLRGTREVTEEAMLLKIHSDLMDQLYASIGSASDFISHSTCFCCLMQTPKHSLPCGHVLCTPCIRSYAYRDSSIRGSRFILTVQCCPLHPADTQWRSPCVIRLKPDHAGVRLLCLDGGGIRGIVELEVLRAIQERLDNRIPLRAFFDLIIGTSTGGIITLAFGVKTWSIDRCIRRFKSVCSKAFTARTLNDIPIMRHMMTLKHGAKYKTTPLRDSLQIAFGQKPLFGSSLDANHAPMVAVTATDEAYRTAIIIANYSREDSRRSKRRKSRYDFPRPDDPDLELKIWEAAAATSAAPTYFKPFNHLPTKRTYIDGAVYHNNPVRLIHQERKLLWPDVAGKHPDILLSIGTGQNEEEARSELPQGPASSRATRRRHRRADERQAPNSSWTPFPRLKQIYTGMQNRMDSILDAEKMWRDFCSDVSDIDTSQNLAPRYVRINPLLPHDPPKLDEVKELDHLQAEVRSFLNTPDSLAQLESVALLLVASSFYYERTTAPRSEMDNMFSCSGQICCRFEDGSDYLRGLGDYLRTRQQVSDFGPYFEIENDNDAAQIQKIPIRPADITRMRDMAAFALATPDIRVQKRSTKITISLHLRTRHSGPCKYPISGFPREIMTEQSHQSIAPDTLVSPSEQMQRRRSLPDLPIELDHYERRHQREKSNRSISDSFVRTASRSRTESYELQTESNRNYARRRSSKQRLAKTYEVSEAVGARSTIAELPSTTDRSSRRRSSKQMETPVVGFERSAATPENPQMPETRSRHSQPVAFSHDLPAQPSLDHIRQELPPSQVRRQSSEPERSASRHSGFTMPDLGDDIDSRIRQSITSRLNYVSRVAGEQAQREIERRQTLAELDGTTPGTTPRLTRRPRFDEGFSRSLRVPQPVASSVPQNAQPSEQPNNAQRDLHQSPVDSGYSLSPALSQPVSPRLPPSIKPSQTQQPAVTDAPRRGYQDPPHPHSPPPRLPSSQPYSNIYQPRQNDHIMPIAQYLATRPSIASMISDEPVMDTYSSLSAATEYLDSGLDERRRARAASPIWSDFGSSLSDDSSRGPRRF